MQDGLAATLLQWSPADLPFREIAFAVLCLAVGGKQITVLPDKAITTNHVFARVKLNSQASDGMQFMSCLVTGAHLRDNSPGSAPEGDFYWLEGVLVVLATQLYRRRCR